MQPRRITTMIVIIYTTIQTDNPMMLIVAGFAGGRIVGFSGIVVGQRLGLMKKDASDDEI